MIKKRACGILLHISSLPSKYGIGDFGPQAYKFIDFLVHAGQSYWQLLPFGPLTFTNNPFSPYNSLSAFAGNTLFISLELLYRSGLLAAKDIRNSPAFPTDRVDYRRAASYKTKLLKLAFERFKGASKKSEYERFCLENKHWLDDYAAFIAIRRHFKSHLWCDWPSELRTRKKDALESAKTTLQNDIKQEKFLQYLFFQQWLALKHYTNQRHIKIIGDIPIYPAYDSADLWSHPEIFKLTKASKPQFVAGVPPDLFSRTGQLWRNPVYNWSALQKTGYHWWLQRIKYNLNLFDIVRIDHFRGFFAYWQVPAASKTAIKGKWVKGPKENFFNALFKHFPHLPVIAEDLGYITPDVRTFIQKSGLPSMKVLLFAFDGNPATNTHYPCNYTKNCVVYTGTHDNNTVRGWFEKDADSRQKKKLFDCLGRKISAYQVSWEFIRLAASSPANTVIVPMQDTLSLDATARMNHPATARGNWLWRLRSREIKPSLTGKLAALMKTYHRASTLSI